MAKNEVFHLFYTIFILDISELHYKKMINLIVSIKLQRATCYSSFITIALARIIIAC